MLHAAMLAFPHPVTQAAMTIGSAVPEDFAVCRRQLERSAGAGGAGMKTFP